MKSKNTQISELELELKEIKELNYTNSELSKRAYRIESELFSLKGNNSMRDHELISTKQKFESESNQVILDEDEYDDESHGFVSEGFHDPNKDY